jgi:ureidoglycolate hydrolase
MTTPGVRMLTLDPLTHDAWHPFGWLPADEGSEHDDADLEFEWHDGHLNFIGHARSEVPYTTTGVRCEMLFRHVTHTQALMPVDADAVFVVAPPGATFAAEDDLATVRAFAVPALRPVLLRRGTWHWGPFPTRGDSVRLLNVQGREYRRDNEMVRLADHGVAYEVALPPDQPRS